MECQNKQLLEQREEVKNSSIFLNHRMNEVKTDTANTPEWVINLHIEMLEKAQKQLIIEQEKLNVLLANLNAKETHLMKYENTLKDTLPNKKALFFLRDKIKRRFNISNKYMFFSGCNYEQIEILRKEGYFATYDDGEYRAEHKEKETFFTIKKTEYEYLNFLGGQNE